MAPFLRLLALPCLAAVLLLPSACAPVVVAGAAAGAASVAADERGVAGVIDDTRIRAQINELWFRHDAEMYRLVTLTIRDGRVQLTGQVPTPEARVDAVRLSWQAAGVHEVLNEVQVADRTNVIDYGRDVVIANTLRSKLLLDRAVRSTNYSIDVVNGIVYVMGIARDQDELDRVIGHARNTEQVRRVINHTLLSQDPKRYGT